VQLMMPCMHVEVADVHVPELSGLHRSCRNAFSKLVCSAYYRCASVLTWLAGVLRSLLHSR
jgi:hypothetical protein